MNNKGVSLAEILISTSLMVIIVGTLHTTLIASQSFWETHNASIAIQSEARKAMALLTRELREADGIIIDQSANSLTLEFVNSEAQNIEYNWADNGGSAFKLTKAVDGGTALIVAHNIKTISLTDALDDITVNLTSFASNRQGELDNYNLVKKITKR
ncbi:MAG: hypothetical protein KC713_04745 [Candidatus Omnitrophica bacterium]|nr:hypothetical protein [Candidatus Omnitrophota bacterium]